MSQGYIPNDPKPYQRQQQPAPQKTQPYPQQYAQQYPQKYQGQRYQQQSVKLRQKRDLFLLISGIIGLAYSVFLIVYFGGINNASLSPAADTFNDFGKQLAGMIALRMVTPHIIGICIAALANAAAWYLSNKWLALGSAAAYLIAGLLFMSYLPAVILPIMLLVVGFIRLNKVA